MYVCFSLNFDLCTLSFDLLTNCAATVSIVFATSFGFCKCKGSENLRFFYKIYYI